MTKAQKQRELEQRLARTDRMTREYYAQQAAAQIAAEIEAEQARQAKEIERIKREQERQRREQERQAEQIARHEKRIADLEFKLEQAQSDIDFLTERVAQLDAQRDFLLLQQTATLPGSKTFESCQRRIVALDNQIHTAESKLAKARHTQAMAERELSVSGGVINMVALTDTEYTIVNTVSA